MIDDNRTNAKLHVKDVVTSDEGEYKCEITFLDITKNCPVVQLVKLTTLGKCSLITPVRCKHGSNWSNLTCKILCKK